MEAEMAEPKRSEIENWKNLTPDEQEAACVALENEHPGAGAKARELLRAEREKPKVVEKGGLRRLDGGYKGPQAKLEPRIEDGAGSGEIIEPTPNEEIGELAEKKALVTGSPHLVTPGMAAQKPVVAL